MKPLRQLLFGIMCGCLVLQPYAAMKVQAQQTSDFQYLTTGDVAAQAGKWVQQGMKPDDTNAFTNTVVDTGISIVGLGFPPAGIALGLFKQYFLSGASGSDPVGQALMAINQRLDGIDQRLNAIDQRLRELTNRVSLDENINRMRELREIAGRVQTGEDQLRSRPSDFDLVTMMGEARNNADKFLDDPDLWKWSDLHVFTVKDPITGKMKLTSDGFLPPDFEPLPALDFYSAALVHWMKVIEYASHGDATKVTNDKSLVRDLQRHAAYLSVRPAWHELDSLNSPDPPQTLPENIMRRVNCFQQVVSVYPTNRMCNAINFCEDAFRRTKTVVGDFQFSMNSADNNTLCALSAPSPRTPPADAGQNPIYGSEAIALWQSWRTPPVDFSVSMDSVLKLFNLSKDDLELDSGGLDKFQVHASTVVSEEDLEQIHGVGIMTLLADRLARLANFGTTREQFIGTFGTTPANYHPVFLYAAANNGDLMWYRQESNASSWIGPRKVGNGWNFKDIIPAGGNRFYALTEEGVLKWYQHNGFNDGSFDWKGPVDVGRGWRFARIFSGNDGIVYAIKDDGTLLWYDHGGFADGGGINTWTGPKAVGSGWGQFKDVFSMGQGIIYAVKQDGQLLWYKHTDYLSGTSRSEMRPERAHWDGPIPVGTGWQNFRAIIPIGDGIILAITNDGKMLWYKHTDYLSGTSRTDLRLARAHWEGPTQIGTGWRGFRKVTAILPATPVGPR